MGMCIYVYIYVSVCIFFSDIKVLGYVEFLT